MNPVKTYENLSVSIYETREAMGRAAAEDAGRRLRQLLARQDTANVIFAAAPSQNELLEHLLREKVDWTRVRAFHQDEYVGIDPREPAGFGNFLDRAIFKKLPFREIHYLLCREEETEEKCRQYTELLKKYPPDLIFLGMGENGHLAFNDPHAADFRDPHLVKVVELDTVCRQQQVHDGCFPRLEAVPHRAMTLTLSLIQSVPHAICVVPTARKARAVHDALLGPVTTLCPASILRTHKNAALYLDRDSAGELPE